MTDPVCRNCKRPRSEHVGYMEVCPTARYEAVYEDCDGWGGGTDSEGYGSRCKSCDGTGVKP